MFQATQQWCESGGGSIGEVQSSTFQGEGEVQSSTFQGENPRSGLNWLCLAMILLEALF